MTTSPSKPAPSLKNHAPSAPPARIGEFLTTQLPRARSVALCQQTMGAPQVVDSWPRSGEKLRPAELAAEMWTLAIEDAASIVLGSVPRYLILVTPKEGGDGARLGFTVPTPKTNEPGPAYTPDAQGAVAQTMAHLTTREQASQTMLIEGLEGLYANGRAQLDAMEKARARDIAHFESVIEAYKALLSAQGEGNKIAMTSANAQIGILSAAYNAQASRSLELLPMLESLSSQKHERDLAVAKQARSDDRKDKLVQQAQGYVFPIIAAKLGLAGPALLGPKPPASAGASSPAPASSAPSPQSETTMQPTIFGARTLRAIEAFLGRLDGEEIEGIQKALKPETAAVFIEIGAALTAEAADIEKRAKSAAASANGTSSVKGAAS